MHHGVIMKDNKKSQVIWRPRIEINGIFEEIGALRYNGNFAFEILLL